MPELTPTGAVDVIQRQVRRVRRRKNFYELQRTLFLTIVAGAGAAIVLLPLALFAPTRVFAFAAWSAAALLAGVSLLLAGATRRRWMATHAVVPWIEERGALRGRLRTLLEIEARASTKRSFFFPLLVAEVGRELERWAPRRLLPWPVPRAAGVTALLAVAALVAMLRFASAVVPTAPTIIAGDAPSGTEVTAEAGAVGAGRVVIAPAAPESDAGDESSPDERATSTLARLPGDLQESIRQQVWGKAWERVRESLARTGGEGGGFPATSSEETESNAEDGDEWEMAGNPSNDATRRRRSGLGRRPSDRTEGADAEAAAAPSPPDPSAPEDTSGGEGGAGAGIGTAPDLFGARSADDGSANGSFELSLAARLRAAGSTARRGAGNAPAALADAHPELAAEQRREAAAHRMVVPAAYETVVREVFAHRRGETAPP